MDFNTYARRPFTVEAIEITEENIEELAPLVGELRVKDKGTKYIQVDRRRVPNIYRVYPGFWMTRMGDNIRCYAKKVFREQFVALTPEIQEWTEYLCVESEGEEELPQPALSGTNVFVNPPGENLDYNSG